MPKRSMLPVAVRKAIGASSALLSEDLPPSLARGDKTFAVHLVACAELSEGWKDAIWDIAETNMKALLEQSSMGWDADEKCKEMFHTDARFIVLALADVPEPATAESDRSVVIGFSMFRFDYEEGEMLLYCYEVQLIEEFRRLGLGEFLVQQLIRIGSKWKMEKVMLTALKANVDATRFYRRVGFTLDPSSPDYVAEDEEPEDTEPSSDYEILSVNLVT